jgi:hypothetical protein
MNLSRLLHRENQGMALEKDYADKEVEVEHTSKKCPFGLNFSHFV